MTEKISEEELKLMEENSLVIVSVEEMHKKGIEGKLYRLCVIHTLEHATEWHKDSNVVSVEFHKLRRMTRYDAIEKNLCYYDNKCEIEGCYDFPAYLIWVNYPKTSF